MKRFIIILFSLVTVISIAIDASNGNVVYAANGFSIANDIDISLTEKSKAEFAYEMAQITSRVVAVPNTDVNSFKMEFAYATAQVTAKLMPIIHSSQRVQFAYEMSQITTKILNEQNLDVKEAKVQFAYECAQLTAKIISNTDRIATGKTLKVENELIVPKTTDKVNYAGTDPKTLIRDNADIEQKAPVKVKSTDTTQKATANPGNISPQTYNILVNELMQVGKQKNYYDDKVKIYGDVRYHYAFNRGFEQWGYDSSGIRAYLGADANINKDWRAQVMLEGHMNLGHYDSMLELVRLNVMGKVGASQVTAGMFGYLMAEGNIYDSSFKGVKVDAGEKVKYSLAFGQTDAAKDTAIATARYTDFDYNLESGVYHFQKNNVVQTIWTLGGNYNFSNFGFGAMYLGASLKDANGNGNGYVFSFNYGDLKSWRPGTYDVFAKYYNQPLGTYISHGMNGVGNLMQGFKGYGFGTHYTFSKDLVGGLEYYNLTDKVLGRKGSTWWSDVTYYF